LHRMKELLESLVAIDAVVKSSGPFLENSFK
jgi:2-dehydro-3-deoxyphosphooctonate aldolase (KDO 8-P synthase)